ncbi:MAG TPA: hypothetical protein VFB80_18760 [Pirellulaceae bacterium]|nr:hypothetical protein [Pirellulaceae bacterium]
MLACRKFILLAALLPLSPGFASAQDDEQEAEATKRYQAHAQATAALYELKTAGEEPRQLKLRPESLLRWTNPLGGNKAHGELFLWTDRGRPAAVLSMYEWTDVKGIVHEHHEWCSLSLDRIAAAGPKVWEPKSAGIELKPLPAAPPPADTPVRRLRQMRDLGAGFAAEKTTREEEKRELRLLSQPAFRYEAGDPDVLDGAVFALVEATDPEAFLLLEARVADGKAAWHYGLARMNSLPLAASYQKQPVWEVPKVVGSQVYNRQDLPYTAFTIK